MRIFAERRTSALAMQNRRGGKKESRGWRVVIKLAESLIQASRLRCASPHEKPLLKSSFEPVIGNCRRPITDRITGHRDPVIFNNTRRVFYIPPFVDEVTYGEERDCTNEKLWDFL